MRKALLKNVREKLLEMRRQVMREIDNDLKQGREGAKDDGMDTYDLASEERDREISFLLSDRERGKLQAIQEALERIEDGSYGMCESCESEIAAGRLEALPFTRLCVSCQSDREKELKQARRFDDERTYRKLSATDVDEENS
ncbi:MAG: TraR/DksA family transcriptional regulator [Deltaproteobacteria bacterium]|nr:TraR/DksA family transcriptional regulator [Deltaproteobacteria bacterium]MBI3388041.1 TraR/DksA family transcriptional regulator [Deltaproteobacteria bacterium]